MRKGKIDFTLFDEICGEVCDTPSYARLKYYVAHADVSVFCHSVTVAKNCYVFALTKKIKCDVRSLVKGALLHDYFLYDWHHLPKFSFHGFRHAKVACENARRDFGLNEKEKNIVLSHMFPLNLRSFPKCREAWIVTLMDKKCALKEVFRIKEKQL